MTAIVLKQTEELALQIKRLVPHQVAALEEAGIDYAEPTSEVNIVLHLRMEQILEAWQAGKLSPLEVWWLVHHHPLLQPGAHMSLLDPGRGALFVQPTLE